MTGKEEDPFIKVWFDEQDPEAAKEGNDFYERWRNLASAKHQEPTHFALDALRKVYPKHSVVMTGDSQINILAYPGAVKVPMNASPLITNLVFMPLARNMSPRPGIILDSVQYGAFSVAWKGYDFIVYIIKCPQGAFGGFVMQNYIVHDGPESPARAFLTEIGIWNTALHGEIWVFNQGFWYKDAGLWEEAQKANWDDVILKDDFKATFRKDIYGFFESERMYKDLAIPWKRGIIMHGPPGNGKTISIKALIKECDAKGLNPLYVKSFHSWMGDEGSMAAVFGKARQLSPCVVILEDLDSLINDENRSFFLNQLDGLEGNDGLLVIGTTNHFERLDPGLSSRPSRFDRKFLFDDPDQEERALYAKYWQNKLQSNKELSFPDKLVDEIAAITDRFSFAYLKEAFVSSLVTLAGIEHNKPSFESVVKGQIKTLRKQLDKPESSSGTSRSIPSTRAPLPRPPVESGKAQRSIRDLLDTMARMGVKAPQDPYYVTAPTSAEPSTSRHLQDTLDSVRVKVNSRNGLGHETTFGLDVPMNERLAREYNVAKIHAQEMTASSLPLSSEAPEIAQRPDARDFRDILDRMTPADERIFF